MFERIRAVIIPGDFIALNLEISFLVFGDTMSPDQHAKEKSRNPFCLPDFVSASHARGTRAIVVSGNSQRSLLHIPPTDPPRRVYRLADSLKRDF